MPHVEVTADAGNVAPVVNPEDRGRQLGVARLTSALGYAIVVTFNANVVGKAAGGKCEGMEEAVGGLDRVLAGRIVRRVTVVASGDGVVAALDPGGVIVLHHVTVGAGLRIVGQVGVPSGIDKCIQAQAKRQPGENAHCDGGSCGSHDNILLAGKRFADSSSSPLTTPHVNRQPSRIGIPRVPNAPVFGRLGWNAGWMSLSRPNACSPIFQQAALPFELLQRGRQGGRICVSDCA